MQTDTQTVPLYIQASEQIADNTRGPSVLLVLFGRTFSSFWVPTRWHAISPPVPSPSLHRRRRHLPFLRLDLSMTLPHSLTRAYLKLLSIPARSLRSLISLAAAISRPRRSSVRYGGGASGSSSWTCPDCPRGLSPPWGFGVAETTPSV